MTITGTGETALSFLPPMAIRYSHRIALHRIEMLARILVDRKLVNVLHGRARASLFISFSARSFRYSTHGRAHAPGAVRTQ